MNGRIGRRRPSETLIGKIIEFAGCENYHDINKLAMKREEWIKWNLLAAINRSH